MPLCFERLFRQGMEPIGRSPALAIREGKWKLLSLGNGVQMLFDMETDPGETKNLAVDPGLAEVLGEHRRMLGEWGEVSKDLLPEAFLNGTSG